MSRVSPTANGVLSPDHPGTLASRNNLAYAYQAAVTWGRAILLYEQNLADRERVFGPDQPTVRMRNELRDVLDLGLAGRSDQPGTKA